ncbi:MAG: hypothetical protein IKA81_02245 [Alistipes sp.]|nr:hypothetical protein [Alistipes sp.]
MKNLKFLLLFAAASLLGFAACDESGDKTEPKDPVVELKANKTEISANGEDSVTFTVYVDNKEATKDCLIINLKDNSTLEGNTFTTTEEGEYNFKATYGKYTSNSVTITAFMEAPVLSGPQLFADKAEIKADGEDMVTFTVTCDEEDVTESSTIINLITNEPLEGNTFTTTEAGEYKFMATCENNPLPSDEITIVATDVEQPKPVVMLEVDKRTIVADGEDKVTFIVTADGKEVSEGVHIFNRVSGNAIEGNTFSTTEAGEYTFIAVYGEEFSNSVDITATPVEDDKPTIVLEADKLSIVADGEDKVTFTVKVDDEAVSEGFEIINLADKEPLAAAEFTTTTAGEYSFKAKVGDAESEVVKITATEPETAAVVTLVADKTTIVADGEDKALFTVKVDGEAVSEGFEIINLADNKPLAAAEFTTTTAGEYSFKAKVGDAESEVVKITATELEASIVLSADKTTIVADGVDAVTFSTEVKNILTEDTLVIINLADNSEVNGTFTTTIAGTYSFQAKKGGVESNVITITATEVAEDKELVLSVSPGTIKADGTDIATFTVKYGEDDVTSQAAIYNNGSALNGTTFSTTTAGSYTFKALYDNKESNEVTITAEQVAEPEPPVGDYAVGTFYNNNGVKGIVFGTKVIGEDTYCYIVSLDQKYIQWSTENVQCGCFNPADGSKNVMSIKYVDSTLEKYPAAKWCEDHGEGWYLPASNELHMLWDAVSGNKHVFKNNPDVEKFNKALTDNGGTAIQETFYWTSNEVSDSIAEVVCFSDGKGVCLNIEKSMQYDVRAIYKFKIK